MNMKNLLILFAVLLGAILHSTQTCAQVTTESYVDTTHIEYYKITKQDGNILTGRLKYMDAKEVVLITDNLGEVSIPKHEIRTMEKLSDKDMNPDGSLKNQEIFSTRYFITTNSLPIEKGESYIQWNLYGPDMQFGLGKNVGVGIMTTWFGSPVLGNIKLSIPLRNKWNAGVGLIAGSGSWALPRLFVGLPFGTVTYGDRKFNLNASLGYGYVAYEGDGSGRGLCSVAGMVKLSRTMSFVFDSFVLMQGSYNNYEEYDPTSGMFYTVRRRAKGGALIIPGIRIQTSEDKAFQFGFAGIITNGEAVPVPIPMIQWYRRL
jgi:hypothetical protein